MRFGSIGRLAAAVVLLAGCGDSKSDPAHASGGNAATAGSGAVGTGGVVGTGGSGSAYVVCAASETYCNGACLEVGEAAAGCKRVASKTVTALVADDALYYGDSDAAAGKLDLTTFADTPLGPALFRTFGLAVDATHVYYATLPTGDGQSTLRIDKVLKSGGTPEAVLPNVVVEEGLDHLRFFAGKLHYRDEGTFGPGKLMQVNAATATPILGRSDIVDFAADATHIYFVASTGLVSSIGRAPLTDLLAVETIVPAAGFAEQLAVLGEHVYWVSSGSLRRAPKLGGADESVGSFANEQAQIVHSDANAVYVWTYGKDEDLLWRFRLGATAPAVFARFQNNLYGDAVVTGTATHLYVWRPLAILQVAL